MGSNNCNVKYLDIIIYNCGLHEKLISIIILMMRFKNGFDIKQKTTYYNEKYSFNICL